MTEAATARDVRRIVIVGAGLAGRMSDVLLKHVLPAERYAIRLVETAGEDESLEPFGGTEVALPSIRAFHGALGIDEDAALRRARGSFALGTAFTGWAEAGKSSFMPFGAIGAPLGTVAFHQLGTRLRRHGRSLRLADYSIAALAAQAGRFARPSDDPRSVLSTFTYGLHLAAEDYGSAIRRDSGAGSQGGLFERAEITEKGSIAAVLLHSGERVPGDLFIDCSGARGLLIGEALGVPFESWRQWLPCDRVQTAFRSDPLPPAPYAHVAAEKAGWTRHVPLQGGAGETRIWCSAFEAPTEGRAFEAGRRSAAWSGNCIAFGAAALLVEPLQSTGLHLVHSGLVRLLSLFPHQPDSCFERTEYNRLAANEATGVRNFLIARYKTNGRRGEPFWDSCRDMSIPDELAYKIALYASRGALASYDEETFDEADWISLFEQQGLVPHRYDALAETIPLPEIERHFARIRAVIIAAVKSMPSHQDYILRHCAAAAR